MDAILQNVCFILENVETSDLFQRFSVYLKIDDYEWLSVGEFVKTDLPYGVNFPILINRKWLENPEIEMKLIIGKNEMIFEGILEIEENVEKQLSVSGVATLFDTSEIKTSSGISIECTIFVDNMKQQASIAHKETQTLETSTKNVETQVSPVVEVKPLTVSLGTSTEGNFVEMEDIRRILENKMTEKIREIHTKYKAPIRKEAHLDVEIEDPKPSEIIVSLNQNENLINSYNLVPRMTRLKQLDQMIFEKTKLVEKLDLEIEMRQKLIIIVEKRNDLKKDDVKKSVIEVEVEKSEGVTDSSETSSESENSEEIEDAEEEEEEEDDEESVKDSKSEEKPVIEKSIVKTSKSEEEVGLEYNDRKGQDESKIEDPFSPQSVAEPTAILSPTTQYLENLRQKILDRYNSKIS